MLTMRVSKKNAVWKACLGAAVIMLLGMNLLGVIYYNSSGIVYDEPEDDKDNQKSTANEELNLPEKKIRVYIVEGAGYFLNSYSDYLLFLNKVEMAELSGVDFSELQFILGNAIEKMQCAHQTYIMLKQKADDTAYKPVIITELAVFNYDAFLEQEGLMESIFNEVKTFLSNGKVREIYGAAVSHTENILNAASVIRGRIEAGQLPEPSEMHVLNEAYARYMLFGEYVARVFQAIE